MSDEYGLPYIPLSRLRDLFFHARMVWMGNDFGERDLWRLYAALEINSELANKWFDRLEKARNFDVEGEEPCPLCFYVDGERVALCNFHRKISELEQELKK